MIKFLLLISKLYFLPITLKKIVIHYTSNFENQFLLIFNLQKLWEVYLASGLLNYQFEFILKLFKLQQEFIFTNKRKCSNKNSCSDCIDFQSLDNILMSNHKIWFNYYQKYSLRILYTTYDVNTKWFTWPHTEIRIFDHFSLS